MSVLVNSTVGIMQGPPEGELAFIQEEGEALKNIVAPWFGTFFYVASFIILFSTNLGVMDWVSRLSADSLKITFLRDNEFWSESKIYASIVWLIAIVGSIILLSGVDQPIVLLLILLNRRVLPEPIKLRGWRLPIMYIILISCTYRLAPRCHNFATRRLAPRSPSALALSPSPPAPPPG